MELIDRGASEEGVEVRPEMTPHDCDIAFASGVKYVRISTTTAQGAPRNRGVLELMWSTVLKYHRDYERTGAP